MFQEETEIPWFQYCSQWLYTPIFCTDLYKYENSKQTQSEQKMQWTSFAQNTQKLQMKKGSYTAYVVPWPSCGAACSFPRTPSPFLPTSHKQQPLRNVTCTLAVVCLSNLAARTEDWRCLSETPGKQFKQHISSLNTFLKDNRHLLTISQKLLYFLDLYHIQNFLTFVNSELPISTTYFIIHKVHCQHIKA